MTRSAFRRTQASATYRWPTAAAAKLRAARFRARGFDAVVRKVKHGFKVYAYRRTR